MFFILSPSHLEPQLWINCVLESEAISSAPQALNWHWPSRRTQAKCLLMWRKNISHIYLTKRTRNRQKDAFPVALIVSAVSLASAFERFPKDKLNEKLRLFFASLRKKDGSHIQKASFTNIWNGISKYLKENCSIDISNDVEFTSSKDVFRAVLVDLKKKGYAGTDHKPVISHEDLRKMYRTTILW